jgi:hypothetical protein
MSEKPLEAHPVVFYPVDSAPSSGQRIQLHLIPASSLAALTGLVSLGGDAVADGDALYDGNGCS